MTVINKLILTFNLFVYRIDSFLYNLIDSILLIAYSIVVFKIIGLSVNYKNFFVLLIYLPVILHVSYMISYIINDIVDYSVNTTQKNIDPLFYDLRPIYYFKRTKFIIVYTIIFYVLLLTTILYFAQRFVPIICLFVVTIILLSFLHSAYQNILRIITFSFMRLTKYTMLIMLLNSITFGQPIHNTTFWIFIFLIIPYVIYSTVGYLKNFNITLSLLREAMILTILVPFLFVFVNIIIISKFSLNILKAIMTGHLLITLPALCISRLSLKMSKFIFGKKLSYYSHIGHLSFTVILFLIEVIVVLNLL